MIFKRKHSDRPKILVVSARHWNTFIRVGDHHFARCFSKAGWRVGYVSPALLLGVHFFLKNRPAVRPRWTAWRDKGFWHAQDGVFEYVPGAWFAPHGRVPLSFSSFVIKNWYRWTFPNFLEVLREKGFDEVDVLYLQDAVHLCWIKKIIYKKMIYRMTDWHDAFPNFPKKLLAAEKEAVQRADITVVTARKLVDRARNLGAHKVMYLPNGVDDEHFSKKTTPPPEYRDIPSPRAVYAGSLETWMDWSLLEEAAAFFPTIQFILIGPKRFSLPNLEKRENVHFLGAKPYAQLPAYLQHAQVGLIPFAVKRFPELISSVQPLKLYEYLAAGLPVVAVKWEEIACFSKPVFLAEDEEDFLVKLKEAVQQGGRWKMKAKRLARENSWEKRFQHMFRAIRPART